MRLIEMKSTTGIKAQNKIICRTTAKKSRRRADVFSRAYYKFGGFDFQSRCFFLSVQSPLYLCCTLYGSYPISVCWLILFYE